MDNITSLSKTEHCIYLETQKQTRFIKLISEYTYHVVLNLRIVGYNVPNAFG